MESKKGPSVCLGCPAVECTRCSTGWFLLSLSLRIDGERERKKAQGRPTDRPTIEGAMSKERKKRAKKRETFSASISRLSRAENMLVPPYCTRMQVPIKRRMAPPNAGWGSPLMESPPVPIYLSIAIFAALGWKLLDTNKLNLSAETSSMLSKMRFI